MLDTAQNPKTPKPLLGVDQIHQKRTKGSSLLIIGKMNNSLGRVHPNMLLEKEKNIDLHAKHPSFITGRDQLGSIGWGVHRF